MKIEVQEDWYAIYGRDELGNKELLCAARTKNEAIKLLPYEYHWWIQITWTKVTYSYDEYITIWEGEIS